MITLSGVDGAELERRFFTLNADNWVGVDVDALGDPDGDGRMEAVVGSRKSRAYLWEPTVTGSSVVLGLPGVKTVRSASQSAVSSAQQ